MKKKIAYFNCLKKSIVWLIGNFCFGIGPLLFMLVVFILSQHKLGFDDIQKIIHGGAVLFVCCAMMGGVLVDYLLAGHRLKLVAVFVTSIVPFAILFLLCLEYLFIVLKITNTNCFNISSVNSIFVVGFSFVYCIAIKTMLLIREDEENDQRTSNPFI